MNPVTAPGSTADVELCHGPAPVSLRTFGFIAAEGVEDMRGQILVQPFQSGARVYKTVAAERIKNAHLAALWALFALARIRNGAAR